MTCVRDMLIALPALSLTWAFLPMAVALPQSAHADRPRDESVRQDPRAIPWKHNLPRTQNTQRKETIKDLRQADHRPSAQHSHRSSSRIVSQLPVGGYFQDHQVEQARTYYGRPENMGFCPPGLARKDKACLPPGHAKSWRKGDPLPASVIYYDVPRSVVLMLGAPPRGYKYVRVASDILLIALGTSMVIDAIEDVVH